MGTLYISCILLVNYLLVPIPLTVCCDILIYTFNIPTCASVYRFLSPWDTHMFNGRDAAGTDVPTALSVYLYIGIVSLHG